LAYIHQHRQATTPFDAVHSGILPSDPAAARDEIARFAEAGVTWWVELNDPWTVSGDWRKTWTSEDSDRMIERTRMGPPDLPA
jgi:hypothetical protein